MSDIDLDAIKARANHGRTDREIASDALVDIPALIARVREQEQEILRLRSALDEQHHAIGQLWAHVQVQHP